MHVATIVIRAKERSFNGECWRIYFHAKPISLCKDLKSGIARFVDLSSAHYRSADSGVLFVGQGREVRRHNTMFYRWSRY